MSNWTDDEKKTLPRQYKCELIYDSATEVQIKDSRLPRDAYLVSYVVDDVLHIDVCRGSKRVDIFDLYYDKFGKDSIKLIDFGHGKTNPVLWNNKNVEKPKKKK